MKLFCCENKHWTSFISDAECGYWCALRSKQGHSTICEAPAHQHSGFNQMCGLTDRMHAKVNYVNNTEEDRTPVIIVCLQGKDHSAPRQFILPCKYIHTYTLEVIILQWLLCELVAA